MNKVKLWIKKYLGLNTIEENIVYLKSLERYTISDVVDRLGDYFLVIGGNNEYINGVDIKVPPGKEGVLFLGNNCRFENINIHYEKTRVIIEPIETNQEFVAENIDDVKDNPKLKKLLDESIHL